MIQFHESKTAFENTELLPRGRADEGDLEEDRVPTKKRARSAPSRGRARGNASYGVLDAHDRTKSEVTGSRLVSPSLG